MVKKANNNTLPTPVNFVDVHDEASAFDTDGSMQVTISKHRNWDKLVEAEARAQAAARPPQTEAIAQAEATADTTHDEPLAAGAAVDLSRSLSLSTQALTTTTQIGNQVQSAFGHLSEAHATETRRLCFSGTNPSDDTLRRYNGLEQQTFVTESQHKLIDAMYLGDKPEGAHVLFQSKIVSFGNSTDHYGLEGELQIPDDASTAHPR